ncbi:MAG: nucleotidyltransferase [Bacteroidia bacterium]|nr:nucleotidyltransferase [Bacteroidia bacterium]
MNIFDDYTKTVLEEFNRNKVKYLVVGGYAVNFYGYRRTTGDIDIWIKPHNGLNKKAALLCFKNLGISKQTLTDLENLDFTKPVVFMDGEEPFRIDFMTFISGVNFTDAYKKRQIELLDGIKIPFIHLNELIISKISSGRTKDKLDVEQLQKIRSLRKGKKIPKA